MTDLETEPPTPEPVAETVAPETPPDPIEEEPEGTVEVSGQKKVGLDLLIAERRKGQALKQKADQFDQVAGYVNQVRPYIEFLQNNPGLMTRTQQETQPTPVTTTQPQDEKAEALARTLDLYTHDGHPDVKRAQAIRTMVKEEAAEIAQGQIRPLEDSTKRERAAFNYQRALATVDLTPQERQKFDAIWARTDVDTLSKEDGAAGILGLAVGLDFVHERAKRKHQPVQTPLQAPLHTESPGSRTMNKPSMSSLDESIAKLRGMDSKTYADRVKGFQRGGPNVLED